MRCIKGVWNMLGIIRSVFDLNQDNTSLKIKMKFFMIFATIFLLATLSICCKILRIYNFHFLFLFFEFSTDQQFNPYKFEAETLLCWCRLQWVHLCQPTYLFLLSMLPFGSSNWRKLGGVHNGGGSGCLEYKNCGKWSN